jgi:hypothetical protein
VGDTAVWAVKQAVDKTWTVTGPNANMAVLGFDTKDDAHGWIMDYLVEFHRMLIQSNQYAAERARAQEYARMMSVAPLMEDATKKH